ncbi:MAG: hypothetical protein LBK13_13975 [Spirochaetales bacterium]|nr:hypothetical protein [Spirochaetales bacterium]
MFRATLCASCGKELRICLNCAFYLPGSHWDCRENISDAVADKERANFCEWFSPADSAQQNVQVSAQTKAKNARNEFEKLFG